MWQNRIVGAGTEDPKNLSPNPKNWRKHPKIQAQALEGALEEIGWLQDIIVNQRTGRMIDGHLRVELAVKNKEKSVPVKYVDLSEEEEEKALITLDPITAMAEADKDLLNDLIERCKTDNQKVKDLLQSIAEKEKLPIGKKTAEDDDYVPPSEIETDIQRGDIFQLGRHRVMCGDSTCREDIERLMDGKKADMVFTSPPYNQGGKAFRLPAFYMGKGDNKTKEEYRAFIQSIFKNISITTKEDTPVLWNVSYNSNSRDDFGKTIFSDNNPFHVMETIIWDKKHGFNVSARGILSRDSELIFLMVLGEDYFTNQGRYDTWYNTWRIGTLNSQTEGHGAAFPVELPSKGIESFCISNGAVLDPFLGSGTTLIACEQLDRICFGMEISPQYVSVILRRFHKLKPDVEIKCINRDISLENELS